MDGKYNANLVIIYFSFLSFHVYSWSIETIYYTYIYFECIIHESPQHHSLTIQKWLYFSSSDRHRLLILYHTNCLKYEVVLVDDDRHSQNSIFLELHF